MSTKILLRTEYKAHEQRSPLVPDDAEKLIAAGFDISVEKSPDRCIPDNAYEAAGCRILAADTWRSIDTDTWILGLKELPDEADPLIHKHIYFAHVYKEQAGWQQTLGRYARGRGKLFDLEYLVNEHGRRIAAFGYWAGFMGATLGLLNHLCHRRDAMLPLLESDDTPNSSEGWLELIQAHEAEVPFSELHGFIMGALGRCGQGARHCFKSSGIKMTGWDLEETKDGGPFPEILDADLYVNCVLATRPIPPFLTDELLDKPDRRLQTIADVSCDPTGPCNTLPIYDACTNMREPIRILRKNPSLDLIAIDHLPSLVAEESSREFSGDLTKALLTLPDGDIWQRAEETFNKALEKI